MEDDLAGFVESRIDECRFDKYYEQGLEIVKGVAEASVDIKDDRVIFDLDMELGMEMGGESYSLSSHSVEVKSRLGELYDSAAAVYEYEQENLFLENYAIDVLRLYAPVDGVEMTCSPLVWNADEIFDELHEGIIANTLALKNKNGYYDLNNEKNKYFLVDLPVEGDVRFLTSRNWSYGFEVNPTEGSMMIAKPVGNQPGLGVLGFCYVPYHFVYDVSYPVLVQVEDSSGEEIFQFPVAVVVRGNKPRTALSAEGGEVESSGLCNYQNNLVRVNLYDSKLNSVDGRVSYKCFDEICEIGETSEGFIEGDFPQCVNGYVIVDAEGYKESKILFSSVSSGSVDVILDRVYELDVELEADGSIDMALVIFSSDSGESRTVVYPEQKKVELSEGQYEITVYVYENSSLKLEGQTQKYCTDIPKEGVGSLIGLTEEKCYEVEIPEQIVSNALTGGGKENYYILESELESSSVVEIDAGNLKKPKTLEELQDNYNLFETRELEVVFK
jgi:hypothetical protein